MFLCTIAEQLGLTTMCSPIDFIADCKQRIVNTVEVEPINRLSFLCSNFN